MIQLGSLSAQDTADIAGGQSGFVWHYVDILDDDGNGIVLIWSLGLPFLPGLAAAARSGRPQAPASRPSLSFSVYRNGKPYAYLLHEMDPEQVEWSDSQSVWHLGDSHITLRNQPAGRGSPCGDAALEALLDCPVPGSDARMTARIEVRGARCALDRQRVVLSPHAHAWAPRLTCAAGRAVVAQDGHTLLDVRGRAYHDGNASPVALHELGIERWTWARVAMPDREAVIYWMEAEDGAAERAVLVEVRPDGVTTVKEDVSIAVQRRSQSIWGVDRPARLRVDAGGAPLCLEARHIVDDGPFYQRLIVQGHQGQDTGWGMAEVVLPHRVDRAWQRPLVRMRVHRTAAEDSLWLPLFSGPRTGRLARLFGQFGGGQGRAA
jgi:carotenoid 1,2-hydratase